MAEGSEGKECKDCTSEMVELWPLLDEQQRRCLLHRARALAAVSGVDPKELDEAPPDPEDHYGSLTSEFDVYVETWFHPADGAPVYPLDGPAVMWGGAPRSFGWLLDALSSSQDIMPSFTCDRLDLPQGSTYREGVRVLKDIYATEGVHLLVPGVLPG